MNRFVSSLSVPRFGKGVRTLLTLSVVTLLTGCSLAPEYRRPEAPVSKQWPVPAVAASAQSGKAAVDLTWEEMFADPKLRQLIQLALDNNRDLRIAVLNIEKAQAQYRIQRAGLLPGINVTGSESAQRTPASVSYTGIGGVTRSYNLDVGISSYELDLFGRIRSLKEEALQSYLSAEATRRATHISLVSEVAGSYLALAADLDLQRLAHETFRSRQKEYDLQHSLTAAGKSSQLELRQSEGELENARDQALRTDKQAMTDRNALELLAGTPLPDALLPSPDAVADLLGVNDLPAGLPSDLLRNRPDILSAEHKLMGANADIGAARAAFFPTISLTASLGRASNELSGLFDPGGRSWNFSPQISLPLFSGGRLLAKLGSAKAEREIAVAEYEKSIQTAFREVADALAEHQVAAEQLAAQRRRAEAANTAYALVRLQYDNDTSSYLEVLDAQRTLYSAQQSLIQAEQARQSNMITLYKVLGGGWSQ
ncbi:TPA: efflux transporter outer membrane subunit [Klebsiella michiganensis]|nr:efflux transporter outer membrane subunit [Klebsiella michiganensis]